MRRPLIALTIAAAALLGACTSAAPGWTFAPPTVPPPSQPAASVDASAAPSAPAASTPAGSGAPGEPTQVPGGGGGIVSEAALNIAYVTGELAAPADTAFSLEFDNQDSGIPHNIEIKDASNQTVFKGDIITGPMKTTYNVGPLMAGSYTFVCTVHPNMTGVLKVGG